MICVTHSVFSRLGIGIQLFTKKRFVKRRHCIHSSLLKKNLRKILLGTFLTQSFNTLRDIATQKFNSFLKLFHQVKSVSNICSGSQRSSIIAKFKTCLFQHYPGLGLHDIYSEVITVLDTGVGQDGSSSFFYSLKVSKDMHNI